MVNSGKYEKKVTVAKFRWCVRMCLKASGWQSFGHGDQIKRRHIG